MNRRIDLYTLRLFVSAARRGSIAQTAALEHIAPSALSRRIADLESVLGAALLVRSPRGIKLTEAGRTVFDRGTKVDQDLDELARDVQTQAGKVSGTVRLYANTSAVVGYLPERLRAFRDEYPLVEVALQQRTSGEIIRACLDEHADVGLCVQTPVSKGVETWFFAVDPLVVVMPMRHELAKKRSVRFADALAYPIVGIQPGSSLDQFLHEQAMAIHASMKISLFVTGFDAVCQLVEVGLGIAIVPTSIVSAYTRRQPFACRPLNERWVRRELTLYALRKNRRAPAVEALIQTLKGHRNRSRSARAKADGQPLRG